MFSGALFFCLHQKNCSIVFSPDSLLLQQMRTLGIYSRLDEVFDAPTAVKQVLIGQFGLDHSVRIYFWLLLTSINLGSLYGFMESDPTIYTIAFLFALQYIGTRETDQNADRVQKLGVFDFWTPDNHYRWSKSRYGNHVSGVVEQVQRSRLLSYSRSLMSPFKSIY